MSLRNINIGPRAFLGFALIGCLMLALGIFALIQMHQIRGAAEDISRDNIPSLIGLGEFNEQTLRQRMLSYRFLLDQEPEHQKETLDELANSTQQMEAVRPAYENSISSPQEREGYAKFKSLQAKFQQFEQRMLSLSRNGQTQELRTLINGEMKTNSDAINELLNQMIEFNIEQSVNTNKQATQQYSTAVNLVVGLLIFSSVLTAGFAWMLIRSITEPIASALRTAEAIAEGNLTQVVHVAGTDEAARLLQAMATMQRKLRETLQEISGSSAQLASAAEELNNVTEESALGLTKQNNEIEQAATAVNEMTSAVEEVARNAASTCEASLNATSSAGEGRDIVQETLGAIERMTLDVQGSATLIGNLANESRDIGKVLDVIRGLADQTNLLALNAAIEAARAGDAGRGFAVVADEVRALAHRTQQSTSEIEHMIASIQSGTEEAVSSMRHSTERAESTLSIARGADKALSTINSAITEINERNLVIASATEEQASVAREVDRNLVNIRDLSIQSSTGADQTSSAAQELSRLAVGMSNLVTRFQL
ncbi:methyl-accepting chemotaxis protein [Pseudomonas sp. CF161]|uniref:methyl-accepting chemotaxis protein n=1 Tax=Pseudomonas sp. CF161 TaxID=911241 RepID=UPI0003553810|nr:methyl-accepting chemotaxis protein [Pseudomonas sp. CF161]EPL08938.1 methyl-accepting chemotaxis protein [Pseudomonas sp. CF161]